MRGGKRRGRIPVPEKRSVLKKKHFFKHNAVIFLGNELVSFFYFFFCVSHLASFRSHSVSLRRSLAQSSWYREDSKQSFS